MHWGKLATTLLLSATTTVSAGRSLRHAGKQFEERAKRHVKPVVGEQLHRGHVERDAEAPLFLNDNTKSEFLQ